MTSKHRASPCVEWCKSTSRDTAIIGVGGNSDNTAEALNSMPIARHIPAIRFQLQVPRESKSTASTEMASNKPVGVLSTHPRNTKCSLDMQRSSGRSPNISKQIQNNHISPTSQSDKYPDSKTSSPIKKRDRNHLRYAYDEVFSNIEPHKKSVNMTAMTGRGITVTSNVNLGLNKRNLSSEMGITYKSSKYRSILGGDFGKSSGRISKPVMMTESHPVKWTGVDCLLKGGSFSHSSGNRLQTPDSYCLHHDPVATLKTRWNGINTIWNESAHNITRASSPSVAAPRSMSHSAPAVIKAATSRLNTIRSTLLRHTREGERKRKERLAIYQSDPRVADKEMSPLFNYSYSVTPPQQSIDYY